MPFPVVPLRCCFSYFNFLVFFNLILFSFELNFISNFISEIIHQSNGVGHAFIFSFSNTGFNFQSQSFKIISALNWPVIQYENVINFSVCFLFLFLSKLNSILP